MHAARFKWDDLLRAALLAVIVALLATLAVVEKPAQASDAIAVEWKADTSTTPPPETLGPYTMRPFSPDSRPLFLDVTTVPAPGEGVIRFDRFMTHERVDPRTGWGGQWGHGYTGDVYFSIFEDRAVISLPANTKAFYLYVQPNVFGTSRVTVTAQDGTTSGPVPVTTVPATTDETNGSAGYFGFYTKDGSDLSTVAVDVPDTVPETTGFAVGEFGIAYGERCTIKGDARSNILRGTNKRDVICGLGGSDVIEGLGGNDLLRGGRGVDVLEGDAGADELYGRYGSDSLDAVDGVEGNDAMNGGEGADACQGDRGDAKKGCEASK